MPIILRSSVIWQPWAAVSFEALKDFKNDAFKDPFPTQPVERGRDRPLLNQTPERSEPREVLRDRIEGP